MLIVSVSVIYRRIQAFVIVEKRWGTFLRGRDQSALPGIKGDRVVLKEAFPLFEPAFEMLAVGHHSVFDGSNTVTDSLSVE